MLSSSLSYCLPDYENSALDMRLALSSCQPLSYRHLVKAYIYSVLLLLYSLTQFPECKFYMGRDGIFAILFTVAFYA